jgi:NAD(P)-dependent dehydrogenase (short-subunit alcohol dehydrogenase family)
MERAVAEGVERFGGIDVVVANAGIASYGSVRAVDPAAFKRVLDINMLGVFHTVRAALPSLVERRGYVLVVSSLAAFAASPGLASYNASKAGPSSPPTRCASSSSTRASTWAWPT